MDEQMKPSSEPAGSAGTKAVGADALAGPARRDLEEEFNLQRARMKELFLQKEEELHNLLQVKQQLESEVVGLHAELQQLQTLSQNQKSEIQSLQLLVNETVEVSSSGSEELRRLTARNHELEKQLAALKQHQQYDSMMAPGMLVRSLARKLVPDAEEPQPGKKDSMMAPGMLVRSLARKLVPDAEEPQPGKKNEENELTNSIIEPLEMEITALKSKLRETDAQLQETLKAKAATGATGSGSENKTEPEARQACDMCANYERQLVAEQARGDAARDRASQQEQALKLATEELEGVRAVHDETIRSWQAERADSGDRLAELADALAAAKSELAARTEAAEHASRRALEHVTTLTVDRETLQKKLDTLERDNAMLVGRYTKQAAEMQNEIINLPDNVAELQELCLQLREQLIVCETGRQTALAAETELRAQLAQHAAALHRRDDELAQTLQRLRDAQAELDRLQTEREQLTQLADKLRHSNDMIEQLLEDKKRLQTEALETQSRVAVLQQQLDNSEKVQQDFVRLSQSLQVEMQRIREADTAVRWQHDDDVTDCNQCHAPLPTNKKKIHCRHCGRIFCGACVCHTVASGPRGAPARVCAVCLTLLQPHAAPYFSTRPPHSPD